jgi:hypothetical protein
MDHIDEVLTTQSFDPVYSAAVRTSLNMAKRTLNRYYELTDSSDVYRITMGKSRAIEVLNDVNPSQVSHKNI